MNKLSFYVVSVFLTFSTYAQDQDAHNTEKVWRINFLNPAIELEVPTGNNTTVSMATGIGAGIGYPNHHITTMYDNPDAINYIIAPFLDLQHKWFYNLEKRKNSEKTVDNNSGNFWSGRFLVRGPAIENAFRRYDDIDFAFGPTWGVQRKYGEKFHFLFDAGPIYYFDTKGNTGFYPLMLQLNLGFDL